MSGQVLRFPSRRGQPTAALVDVGRQPARDELLEMAAKLRAIAPDEVTDGQIAELTVAATNLGFVLGGLFEAASAADAVARRPVIAPVHVPVHQLPGFRPFQGVAWMPTRAEQAGARARRRAASHQWFKEIFARGR